MEIDIKTAKFLYPHLREIWVQLKNEAFKIEDELEKIQKERKEGALTFDFEADDIMKAERDNCLEHAKKLKEIMRFAEYGR